MIASLALIFLSGMAAASLCQGLRMPRLVGVLVAGIAAGPFALNLLDASILSISADLRKIALVIILIKAGLSLDPAELKKGRAPRAADVLSACIARNRSLCPVRSMHLRHFTGRSRPYGRGDGGRFSGRGCPQNGTAYGESAWNGERCSTADPCRCIAG